MFETLTPVKATKVNLQKILSLTNEIEKPLNNPPSQFSKHLNICNISYKYPLYSHFNLSFSLISPKKLGQK